jgi:hypothetical protein
MVSEFKRVFGGIAQLVVGYVTNGIRERKFLRAYDPTGGGMLQMVSEPSFQH